MVILLDSKKTERYRIVHRIKPDILLRLGKAVTGEAPTLEEMFQACKLKEFDLVKAQQLLFDAPYFITMMPRDEGERWMKKIERHLRNLRGKERGREYVQFCGF